ncbi:Nucleic acid-binding, OB-fold [Pseudocohnilembus persalinus]|uniref:Nucleic acid-binding, OB-fold n=1 Tax=Pseudocohnilembus persalinus TaxID=266149 RepID=A0A0V0QYJ0_PSEPJ|nr:Nucleic acid-binding, OB-fold [Pseudocohnilembus persalinus]|eukprot:KRX07401.1 Nucleic acid-binding, OB-fold [Pseudocohnilembus persalinus]
MEQEEQKEQLNNNKVCDAKFLITDQKKQKCYKNFKDIKIGMVQFVLICRCIDKQAIKNIKSYGGKMNDLFEATFLDQQKNEIKAIFPNKETCNIFFDKIQQGRLYQIENVQCKTFSNKLPKKLPFCIHFGATSEINQIQENDIIEQDNYNIINIQKIRELQKDDPIDVIGIIIDVSPIQIMKIKGESKEKREVTIFDKSMVSIKFSLWGISCQNDLLQEGNVVLIKDAKVGDYQNIKNVNLGFNYILKVNEFGHKKTKQLYDWYQIHKDEIINNISASGKAIKKQFKISNIEDQDLGDINLLKLDNIQNIIDFSQIVQKNQKQEFYIKAFIQYLKPDGKWYYLSCSKCPKKAEFINQKYYCHNHGEVDVQAKYISGIKITDQTGFLFATIGGQQMEDLIGISADEMRKLVEDGQNKMIQMIIYRVLFQEFIIKICTSLEFYQGEDQIKHQIIQLMEPNFSDITEQNIQIINAYEEFTVKGGAL